MRSGRGSRRDAAPALPAKGARLDLVVRPAQRDGVLGYGLTVYHYAFGDDAQQAESAWSAALEKTTPVMIAAAESLFAPVNETSANAIGGEDS